MKHWQPNTQLWLNRTTLDNLPKAQLAARVEILALSAVCFANLMSEENNHLLIDGIN